MISRTRHAHRRHVGAMRKPQAAAAARRAAPDFRLVKRAGPGESARTVTGRKECRERPGPADLRAVLEPPPGLGRPQPSANSPCVPIAGKKLRRTPAPVIGTSARLFHGRPTLVALIPDGA